MDSSSVYVSSHDLCSFHTMDRMLYTILITQLFRDPMESMQIMALWLWLERGGCKNAILMILSLPLVLINKLADEAVTCLNCLTDEVSPSSEPREIRLTRSLMKREISLQFFYDNQLLAKIEIRKILTDICIKAFGDIIQAMERIVAGNIYRSHITRQSPAVDQSFICAFDQLGLGANIPQGTDIPRGSNTPLGRTLVNEVPPDARTLFITFSKGYPVVEWEVREFFTYSFGDCIEALHMQEVRPEEQPLYARIVFHRPSTIDMILNGAIKAKFTINGKHVWMRKFVPKHSSPSPLLRLPESLPGSV